MTGTDHLVRMAGQIVANLATSPDPVAAVAEHFGKFWTRAMIADLASERSRLCPVAAAALERLGADG